MVDIDYRAVWGIGKGVFTLWFVPAGFITNLFYARRHLKLSWAKAASADLAMTTVSWVVTVGLPIWLLLWAGVHAALPERAAQPAMWVRGSWFIVLPMAAVISAGSQVLLLRRFGHTVTKARFATLSLLNALCIVLASYATWTHLTSHPPLA